MRGCELLDPSLRKTLSPQELRLYNAFLKSPAAIDCAIEIASHAEDRIKRQEHFNKVVHGHIFERIALTYLEAAEAVSTGFEAFFTDETRILSTNETFSLYKLSNPDKDIISDYGLSLGIEGVSIPDGLLLRDGGNHWLIEKIYESKLGAESEHDRDQISKYLDRELLSKNLHLHSPIGQHMAGSLLHQLCPELPPKPLVTPSTIALTYLIPGFSHLDLGRGEIKRVPITFDGFYAFADTFIKRCGETPKEALTLAKAG